MRAAKASATTTDNDVAGGSEDWATKMRNKVVARKKETDDVDEMPVRKEERPQQRSEEESEEEEEDGTAVPSRKRPRLEGTGTGTKSNAAFMAPSRQMQVQDRNLLSAWEQKRQEFKERKRLTGNREKDTMSKLSSFMNKIKNKPKPSAGDGKTTEKELSANKGGLQAPKSEKQELRAEEGPSRKDKNLEAKEKDLVEEGEEEGYAGKIDSDIDHRAYMPAAWRLDTYLGGGGGGSGNGDGGGDEEVLDDSLDALRGHKLEFHASKEKDGNARRDNVDDYVVVDPLLEAGKAKFNKQNQKNKKRQTEWAGRSRD